MSPEAIAGTFSCRGAGLLKNPPVHFDRHFMKTNTEQLLEAYKAALPIHKKEAARLYQRYGPKVALNYLRVAGNPRPAPKRNRPRAKTKKEPKRPIHNIECPKCGNSKSWGVGGGNCSGGRYRTYKCVECLKCHRLYLD